MKTLFDKIWDKHLVQSLDEETDVLWIDRHYIHEVTSPQAFQSLADKNVRVFRPDQTTATADHNVPTINQHLEVENEQSRLQLEMLSKNCREHKIELFSLGDDNNGIVHVIGPELGLTQPGMTIVCGDSHTSTHGAFGTVAFGIGTSQVAQALASQCVLTSRPKTMLIKIVGALQQHVAPKDVILHVIQKLGTDAGTGYFIEFGGEVIENMSMEGRMTICNMSIEMGARGGLIAADQTTINYLSQTERGCKLDHTMISEARSDGEDCFDKVQRIDATKIEPTVSYGTNPGMSISVADNVPTSEDANDTKALGYMGLEGGQSLEGIRIQHVFIGSCTNGRFEDFALAAKYIKGHRKAKSVRALLVPGSNRVLAQLKDAKLDKVYEEAGFELREPGCSACLAMNGDTIPAGEYCVSTSNRNFEGRQGAGARTILASPIVAAISAITGEITNPKNFKWKN